MAITRAQQAKQMLQNGGRIGLKAGAQFEDARRGESISPGTKGRTDPRSGPQIRDDNPYRPGGDDGPKEPPSTVKVPKRKPKETDFQKFKRTFNPFPIATTLIDRISKSKLARINNAIQRQNYINSLDLDDPEDKKEYDNIMSQLSSLGMDIIAGPRDLESTMLSAPPSMLAKDPMTQFKTVDGVSTLADEGVKDVLGQGYEDYLNRFETTEDRDGPQPLDPCKGLNPPAYCFIGEKAEETIKAQRNLAGLTPRIGGSMFDYTGMADGGIASLEDMDREAFLLGGIAKGLKKAVRGVKKIAKSPIGKAALIGAGFGLAGIGPFSGLAKTQLGTSLGGFFGKGSFNPFLRKVAGDTAFSGLGSILSKAGLVSKAGLPTFKGGIALASILPLLVGKTDEEKDDILKEYYASQKLTPSTTARQAGSEFDFYNYNLAEGGTPRKEPVAKKVMPLLDMGGMEKDYRAEGGFVPIGRMEKADDVPARLSKNEFVFTADAVRNAGDGDVDKGAEVMYNMMKNLEAGGEVSEESQGLDGAREMFQTSQRLGEVI